MVLLLVENLINTKMKHHQLVDQYYLNKKKRKKKAQSATRDDSKLKQVNSFFPKFYKSCSWQNQHHQCHYQHHHHHNHNNKCIAVDCDPKTTTTTNNNNNNNNSNNKCNNDNYFKNLNRLKEFNLFINRKIFFRNQEPKAQLVRSSRQPQRILYIFFYYYIFSPKNRI